MLLNKQLEDRAIVLEEWQEKKKVRKEFPLMKDFQWVIYLMKNLKDWLPNYNLDLSIVSQTRMSHKPPLNLTMEEKYSS